MNLSQTAEYAIRAMCQLALGDPDMAVSVTELSEQTRIPSHYLSKVMRRLVVAELVVSKRGHHGGFSLAWAPEDISMMDILKAVEHSFDDRHCVFGWPRCDDRKPCPAHDIWKDAKAQLVSWAGSHTLADVRERDTPRS